MDKVLVTGSEGFIGKHLVERLEKEGYRVKKFDLPGRNIKIHSQVCRALESQDIAIHLAAVSSPKTALSNPRNCIQTNMEGTFNFFEGCRINKVGKIVFVSSREAGTESIYGLSKLFGEALAIHYVQNYGMNITILRFSDVYGPGQSKTKVIPKFIQEAKKNQLITITNMEKKFLFIHIDDLVEGVLLSLNYKINPPNTYSLYGPGHPINLKELAELVIKEVGSPYLIEVGAPICNCNEQWPTPNRTLLKWERKVCLEEGIRRLISE